MNTLNNKIKVSISSDKENFSFEFDLFEYKNKFDFLNEVGHLLQKKSAKDRIEELDEIGENASNFDVHTGHCCIYHGCKYGKEDCSVATGLKTQEGACQTCYELAYEYGEDYDQ